VHRYRGAGSYKSVAALVSDDRLLADRIDGKGDLMTDAAGVDLDRAALAVEDERHRHQRLQGIALRAAVGRDVGLAARYSHREVEHAFDDLRQQSGDCR
jgi:hypothetical protein